jgi:hypothetical protein
MVFRFLHRCFMKRTELTAISKHAWELVELSKSSTLQNVTQAVANGSLKVPRSELPRLVHVIQSSIEQGYNAGIREFETQLQSTLTPFAAKKK